MIHLHHNYLSEKRIKINMKQTIVGTKKMKLGIPTNINEIKVVPVVNLFHKFILTMTE